MYHQAMTHCHSNMLSLFNIPFVLNCATKILKIGLQIKIYCPKMFLNRDFCMEKSFYQGKSLFSRTKTESFNILLEVHKTNTK